MKNMAKLKKFLEPAMFCHLAVLIYLWGKVKDPRISLVLTVFGYELIKIYDLSVTLLKKVKF